MLLLLNRFAAFGLAAALALSAGDAAWAADAPPTVAVSAAPFKVEITGAGPRAVVLIPGFSCAGEVWAETVRALSPTRKCYTLTMPGFAGVAPQTDPQFGAWTEAVADFIRREKLAQPIVIGHSLGGILALNLAAGHPGLVGKVVVVDALPCLPALQNPAFQPKPAPDCAGAVQYYQAMSAADFARTQRMATTQLVADTAKIRPITAWALRSDRATLGGIFCQLMNLDLRPRLATIACPTLVLLEAPFRGMADVVAAQYAGLKGVRLAYANQGMHFVMYDDPAWYLAQVTAFVR